MVKPSPNAIQLPKSFKDKESLNTTKRIEGDLPRPDDIFVKGGFTWAEFNTATLPKNPAQVRINLSKADQIWYYLGKTSTEAKAQFTEDLSRPRHNPRGHFLDTIPKNPPPIAKQTFAAPYPNGQMGTFTTQTPIRPPLPHSNSSGSGKDKPYVYKPRVSTYDGNAYRVDQQAYQSQQSFLQNSQQRPQFPPQYQNPNSRAPYAFGTDPRWQASESKTAGSVTNQASGSSWNGIPSEGYQKNYVPANGNRVAPSPTHYSQYPGARQPQASVAPQLSPSMPQFSQSQSRPTSSSRPEFSPSATPQPQEGSPSAAGEKYSVAMTDGIIGRAPASTISSNTTPSQHRPPILPPGGSQRHQSKPSNSSSALKYQPAANAQNNQNKAAQIPYSPQAARPNNPFRAPQVAKPNVFAKYSYLQKEHNRSPLEYRSPYRPNGGFMNGYQGNLQEHMKQTLFSHNQASDPATMYNRRLSYTSNQQSQSPVYQNASPVPYTSVYAATPSQSPPLQTSWDRKDTSPLHPAIRQDYVAVLPQEQPGRPASSHQQSPAAYDRPASQASGTYYTPQYPPQPRQITQENRPAHASLSAAHPQTYNQAQRQGSHPQQAGEIRQSFHPKDASPPPPRVIAATKQGSHLKSSKQAKQARLPPTMPDMGIFKVTASADSAVLSQTTNESLNSAIQPNDHQQMHINGVQTKTFTDVPVDSTSILERLFSNLRKVGNTQAQDEHA